MANRRMFSVRIANSARFLQMPSEAQLLYFHLIVRADDDGVVESYPVMKLLGLASDNFKILISKGFIRQLNEDQVVVILDWREHNTIRADRKTDSIYLPLLKKVVPEIDYIEPKPRSDVKDNTNRLGGPSTDSISKVKLSKDNKKEEQFVLNSQKILNGYNKVFKKNFKSTSVWYKNYVYWRKTYSDKEIATAIIKASQHPWWKDKLTLEKLFRTRNKNGECDYIGELLNS